MTDAALNITPEEDKAMMAVIDAVTLGIVEAVSSVRRNKEGDLVLSPEDEAAGDRLQRVLDAIDAIYPPKVVSQWAARVCGTLLT